MRTLELNTLTPHTIKTLKALKQGKGVKSTLAYLISWKSPHNPIGLYYEHSSKEDVIQEAKILWATELELI
jgi:hypothetical protein